MLDYNKLKNAFNERLESLDKQFIEDWNYRDTAMLVREILNGETVTIQAETINVEFASSIINMSDKARFENYLFAA